MTNRGLLTLLLSTLFVTSGCLDGLDSQNDFWGEDCEEVADSKCIAGPAPDFELVDQFNNTVNMSQFEGKIVVITFLYTHCPDACPAVTSQMKRLSDELGDDYGESVVFLSVTVDPERDTPEALASFMSTYNASWQFLSTTDDSPVGAMSPVWQDYGIYVNIEDRGACSGHGHYMPGEFECMCDVGYVKDDMNSDVCLEDPDYDHSATLTFENGSIESNIIEALDIWSSGYATENQVMISIDALASQLQFGSEWVLVDINGSQHSSSTYYDDQNLTLIEFFHTDCSHCQNQIPSLKEFHANHSSNVTIVSVGGYGLGGNTDNISTIQNFTIEHNTTWPYLYDDSNQLMQTFEMSSYPSWVLLDGNQIIAQHSGSLSYEALEAFTYTETVNFTEHLLQIIGDLSHWKAGHFTDIEMLRTICNVLEHDCGEVYYVTHSSKTYIIDQDGNMRVVWRGYSWTYASIYHDIMLLL